MYRTEIYSQQYGGIATCEWTPNNCGNGVTKTYREPNAKLMAAAPELLEALKEADIALEDAPDSMTKTIARKKLRAAIAKAEGA